jgi:methylated-DNA-protein-cysteine methyltransferase related protein
MLDAGARKLGRRSEMSWALVYQLVKKIPRGRVTTYGALAKRLRIPGGARVVGYAMAGCPSGRGIPWHRVVGAGGWLIIREPYGSLQRKLLESEGVKIEGARVDMKLYALDARKTGAQNMRRKIKKTAKPRRARRR